ncbi:hypothetical protein CCR95_04735 [Thiocystis minor]|uniref:Uma2 family endonuclease n=1 Tax=Thiocystis minor TaxID=61597 RepID=UPI001913061F|nr:Uma2 family endonuclease [Thiocystis minor]MBK5963415.1 hypothetical protein [Thiocystis minor]
MKTAFDEILSILSNPVNPVHSDIVAACGKPEFEDAQIDTLLNPVLIVEVLSDSTEGYDRGVKFLHYRTLSSLQDYLLVAKNECRIEHYARQVDHRWLLTEYQRPDETLILTSVGGELSLQAIYERDESPRLTRRPNALCASAQPGYAPCHPAGGSTPSSH